MGRFSAPSVRAAIPQIWDARSRIGRGRGQHVYVTGSPVGLGADGELLSATRTGQDWLDRLRTPEMPGRADALLTGLAVRVTANAARSGRAGRRAR